MRLQVALFEVLPEGGVLARAHGRRAGVICLPCLPPLQVERGPVGWRAIVVLIGPLHGDGLADAVARLGRDRLVG